MKKLLAALCLLALGCAKYTPTTGPPRMVIRAPRTAYVEAIWEAKIFMEGEEYIGTSCMIVDVQNAPLFGPSCKDVYGRSITVTLRFPRSIYMEMARRNPFGILQPGDTLEPIPEGPLTTPLFDEWGWDGDVHVRFSLWRAEPDNKGGHKITTLVAAKTFPVRLFCTDCMV